MGVLRQTPGPSVSAAAVTTAAAAVVATAETATAVAAVVVADHVTTTAVMRMRDHLVGHVLLVRAEELLQSDDGRDHESDLANEQGLTGYQGNRAKCQRQ